MRLLIVAFIAVPALAFAAGGGGNTGGAPASPPKTTQTTKSCSGIKVWDSSRKKCVNPRGSSLDQDTLYDGVRELAYAGRLKDAQGVLRAMADQNDDRVLTYWGFTHRKLGNVKTAHAFYTKAIARNPDNILARSYMGQGLVEDGRRADAIEQWREIMARGGDGSWAEASLRKAILTGTTYSY